MDMNMKEYVNWKISHDVKYGEAEGYPLVLEQCRKNKDLKNFRVYGNSVQDGTPTPESPIEIQSVGELTTKNLFDKDNTEYIPINYLSFETNGSLYTIQGKSGAFVYASSGGELKIPFLQNFPIGTYTVSMFVTLIEAGGYGNNMRIYMGTTTESTSIKYQRSFTIGEKTKISFTKEFAEGFGGMKIMLNSCKWEIDVSSIQIEEGSTATEYEPYHKYKIPVRARGKNLLDVNSVYPNYINDEGGITYNESVLYKIYSTSMLSEYKENTQYTFTADYEITGSEGNSVYPYVEYTDGTATGFWTAMGGVVTGDKSGKIKVTTSSEKTVKKMFLGYSYNHKVNVSLTNMVIVEGATAEEYEPYIEPQTFNIYLDEPLNYAENVGVTYTNKYSDYIDFNTQTLQTETMKIILTGDEPWKARTNCTNAFNYSLGTIIDGGLCTHYPSLKSSAIDNQSSVYILNTSMLIITDLNYDNVNDFKAFLKSEYEAGIPVTCIVGIKDETTEEKIILPTIPKTQAKTMIYEVGTTIQPSNMYGKYIKKH